MDPRTRRWSILLALVTLVFSLSALTSCGDDDNSSTAPPLPPTELPHILAADWAIVSATVNGSPQDLADFFEWEDGTTGAMMLLNPDGTYNEREYGFDRTILSETTGTINIQNDVITITETSSGNSQVFHGTWEVDNHVLTLRHDDGTDVTVLVFHQIRSITMMFTVNAVIDPNELLGGAITDGMTGRGFYSYDLAPSDSLCSDVLCHYYNTISPCGLFVDLDGFSFRTNLSDLDCELRMSNDDNGTDQYRFRSSNNISLGDNLVGQDYVVEFNDDTGTAIDDTSIPLAAPVLVDWSEETSGLGLSGGNEVGYGYFSIHCTITWVIISG